jgi:cytochrome c5
MSRKIVSLATAISVALPAALALAAPAKIDEVALLEERCSVCHKSERPKSAKKTRAEWEKTVTRMIGKGAKLSDEEKKALIEHLAKNYKP